MEPQGQILKPRHAYFSIGDAPMEYCQNYIEQAEAQGWEFVSIVFASQAQIQNSALSIPGKQHTAVIALYKVVIRKKIEGENRPEAPEFVDPAILLREQEGNNGKIEL